ncbi:MAG: Arm DNA-binding domain-containing protein, partial [Aestuariivirga sp.]
MAFEEEGDAMDLAKADRLLRSLKVKSKPYDRALGGSLSCRVAASGAKTISLKMMIHGKQQRLKLGVYPAITIADAYAKAQGLRAQVKMGHDPRVDSRRAE